MTYDNQGRGLKVGVVVYGIDPTGLIRFLMRHNKPYDGKHNDEWTFVWGGIEQSETVEQSAAREVAEEFGITKNVTISLSPATTEFTGLHGLYFVQFCIARVDNIEIPVSLNEESIGYDWMLYEDACKHIRPHEKVIFDSVMNTK